MIRDGLALVAAVVVALTVSACGGGIGDPADETPEPPEAGESPAPATDGDLAGELTVFAAASLHVVFEDIAELFTAEHPAAEVAFSFAGSSDLVAQLDAGAPGDVLATADESTMATAVDSGVIDGAPQVFAENALALITPAGNPAGITGLDESLDGADLVVCAPQLPCGAAAETLAEQVGTTLRPVSEEGSVTDVLGKVTSGQADAGLVYTTDAASAGAAVDVIAVDGVEDVVNRYPVAVTTHADDPDLARAWAEFLLGPEAQDVLEAAGFAVP